MAILFTIDDVRKIRKLAKSFDTDTFDTFALEVQRNYLPKLLGDALYHDVITNPGSANNIRLLNGDIYPDPQGNDIIYEGLKVYMAYLWLYTFSREGNFKYSEVGPSQYQDDNSQRAGNRSDQDTKIQLGDNANFQGRETIKFLTENRDDFPKFIIDDNKAEIMTWGVSGSDVNNYTNDDGFKFRNRQAYNFRDIDFNRFHR